MYSVDLVPVAQEQRDALPYDALNAFAELQVVLETAPWSGPSYAKDLPDGPMRSYPFGSFGMVVYVILEARRTVEVVTIVWAGRGRHARLRV